MESDLIASALQLGFGLMLLTTAYFTGRSIERNHYRDIRRREVALRHLPAVTFRNPPKSWQARDSGLVLGSVVISTIVRLSPSTSAKLKSDAAKV